MLTEISFSKWTLRNSFWSVSQIRQHFMKYLTLNLYFTPSEAERKNPEWKGNWKYEQEYWHAITPNTIC